MVYLTMPHIPTPEGLIKRLLFLWQSADKTLRALEKEDFVYEVIFEHCLKK